MPTTRPEFVHGKNGRSDNLARAVEIQEGNAGRIVRVMAPDRRAKNHTLAFFRTL